MKMMLDVMKVDGDREYYETTISITHRKDIENLLKSHWIMSDCDTFHETTHDDEYVVKNSNGIVIYRLV